MRRAQAERWDWQRHAVGEPWCFKKPLVPALSEAGIDKNLAQQARVLGRLSGAEFEQAVKGARDAVGRSAPNSEISSDCLDGATVGRLAVSCADAPIPGTIAPGRAMRP